MNPAKVITRCLLSGLIGLSVACSEPTVPDLLVVDRRPHPDHGIYLVQGEVRNPVFTAAPLGHLLQITYSSRRGECVFAYNPPPAEGRPPVLRTSLYSVPVETPGAQPQILIEAAANEVLLDPVFSPDSRELYWVRASGMTSTSPGGNVALQVTRLQDMQTRKVLDNAIWPAPAPDGARLAFVPVDPHTLARGLSILHLQSGEITELLAVGAYDDIDAPLFSRDGDWIYFFGPAAAAAAAGSSWLQWLGIKSAHAHINRPGVWWKISVDGEQLQPVTGDSEIISNAARSDAGILTYTSSLGVRLLSADGVSTLLPQPFFGGVAEYAR